MLEVSKEWSVVEGESVEVVVEATLCWRVGEVGAAGVRVVSLGVVGVVKGWEFRAEEAERVAERVEGCLSILEVSYCPGTRQILEA